MCRVSKPLLPDGIKLRDPFNQSKPFFDSQNPFSNLRIYPNPTPGLFNIEMDNTIMGELWIDIFTEQGSKILKIKFLKEMTQFITQIDLSVQPSGMYLIGLQLEDHSTSRNLLVE